MREKDKILALKLVFSALNMDFSGQDFNCGDTEIEWENIYRLLKKHDVAHLLAYAIKKNDFEGKDIGITKDLKRDMLMAVYRYERLYFEQQRIQECLISNNIPFILLKGAVIRKYYIEPWLRTSCDIDILVPIDNLSQTAKIIAKTLDYRVDDKEAYDISLFSEGGVHLEIHSLMEGDSDEKKLLSLVWDTSCVKGNSEHFMSNELFYFYHIAHMAKHFRNGGCGVRPFIDLKVMQKAFSYDRATVDDLLIEWGLKKFESSALSLADCWEQGIKTDLISMENYILYGGVYGAMEQYVAATQKTSSKSQYIKRRIFMPYEELKKRYKVLEKHKWLTPLFEVIRWISLLSPTRAKQTARELNKLQRIEEKHRIEIAEMFSNLEL